VPRLCIIVSAVPRCLPAVLHQTHSRPLMNELLQSTLFVVVVSVTMCVVSCECACMRGCASLIFSFDLARITGASDLTAGRHEWVVSLLAGTAAARHLASAAFPLHR